VDTDEDRDAYIEPAKKAKPMATAQPSMTDFFEKPGGSKAKKAAQGNDEKISMDELQLESAPPVAPRTTAPRREAAAAKPHWELYKKRMKVPSTHAHTS
jgi:hypothetical protein